MCPNFFFFSDPERTHVNINRIWLKQIWTLHDWFQLHMHKEISSAHRIIYFSAWSCGGRLMKYTKSKCLALKERGLQNIMRVKQKQKAELPSYRCPEPLSPCCILHMPEISQVWWFFPPCGRHVVPSNSPWPSLSAELLLCHQWVFWLQPCLMFQAGTKQSPISMTDFREVELSPT